MNHHNKCTWLHSPVLDQRMSHFKNPTTCYLLETQTKKQTQTNKKIKKCNFRKKNGKIYQENFNQNKLEKHRTGHYIMITFLTYQ